MIVDAGLQSGRSVMELLTFSVLNGQLLSLLVNSFLNREDLVAFVLTTKNAVQAERLSVFLAVCFHLLLVVRANLELFGGNQILLCGCRCLR